jgi:K(+)-stimulated pyrophosphate-energized sodium pump
MLATKSKALRKLGVFILSAALSLAPALALAAGGENVRLVFSQQDMVFLFISLGIGVLALVFGGVFRSQVLKQSPGDERMQEVGKAIQDGARAYLSKQVSSMAVFVVLLAVGLFLLYQRDFGPTVAALVAGSFVLGVAASYTAGYVGMGMAVAANMRTAAAALTSNKRSLETAFRSGAVAGMFTVGMGLLGATLIFIFAQENAMKLLVGFGFGGSLAALFMRVGGGIYTKAADVGADLVGKVEAGIPEDDPRNPAVIADNVGDNVGDCAGMAADVFESYEVTLVAAIVLGAATAAIFDQSTWMRLIIFALMARGVGIIASIIGVYMVKGSDNVDTDPLKPIGRGFGASALIAAVLTFGLAYLMMGGAPQFAGVIKTNLLTSQEQEQYADTKAILAVREKIAKERNVPSWQISADDVAADESLKAKYANPMERQSVVSQALFTPPDRLREPEPLEGFTLVSFADKQNPLLGYATTVMPMPTGAANEQPKPKTVTFGERFKEADLRVFKIDITTTPPEVPNQPKPEPTTQTIYFGPSDKAEFDKLLAEARKRSQNQKIEVRADYQVRLFARRDGKVVAGIEDPKGEVPLTRVTGQPLTFYKQDPATISKLEKERETNPMTSFPPTEQIPVARVRHKEVPWSSFFICILFGIFMAFIFERLTDYYVSTHKKPVKEVAEVATAGPAPMIIQGFALGQESSVFSLGAIVVCLIAPLIIFPPGEFGGYLLSFYGIALVGLGLLTTTGYILAMDTFGPISDNAQGVFEMSGAGHDNESAGKGIQRLDAAGNTTKALTKGFAIATAVVAAVALFHSFVESAMLTGIGMRLDVPEIFLGLLIGGAAPYLFSAFSINAVGRAAFQLINEVRQQFKNDPGIMLGKSKPDYGRCVAIVTAAAQKELLGPGVLAIALPVAVAFGFSIGKEPVEIAGKLYNLTGAQALGGFLAGTILSGQLLAVLLANSGGIWDNAKKLIEDGLHGGKGTDAHKAGVVCDTVGDPFKDTAGPALNPLIKVMNLIALLLVPAIIAPLSNTVLTVITALAIVALALAFWWSKRSSIGSEMAAISKRQDPEAQPEPAKEAEGV